MIKKILSDGWIIENGFRIDLLDDGVFILDSKDVWVDKSGNFFKIKGDYFPTGWEAREAEYLSIENKPRKAILTVFLDEPVDAETISADEVMSSGWDSWTIE